MEYGGEFSDASDQETIAKSGKLASHQAPRKWQDKKAQLGRMLLSQAGKQAVRAKSMAELRCELEAFKPPKAKAMGWQGWRHKGSRVGFSTSCARDPVACMLELQEVRPGLVLPT